MEVTAKSYTLHDDKGRWLGQIVLTSDGMFSSVTDYGNISTVWRHTGMDDFRKFLIGLDVHYFSAKMYQGMSFFLYGKNCQDACKLYAEKILPELKKALITEIEHESRFESHNTFSAKEIGDIKNGSLQFPFMITENNEINGVIEIFSICSLDGMNDNNGIPTSLTISRHCKNKEAKHYLYKMTEEII